VRDILIDKPKLEELRLAVKAAGGLEAYSRSQSLEMLPPSMLDSKHFEAMFCGENVYREEARLRGL
jgi:hypothetical protein